MLVHKYLRKLAYGLMTIFAGIVVFLYFLISFIAELPQLSFADSSYYSRVEAAWKQASPKRRGQILKSWATHTGPIEGSISPWGLHDFLSGLGYCSNFWDTKNCEKLPAGTEAEGIAKDWLLGASAPFRPQNSYGNSVPACAIRTIPRNAQHEVAAVDAARPPGDSAVFLGPNQLPTTMDPGESGRVVLAMRNNGTTTWTSSESYVLGSQNPPDSFTWGSNCVELANDVPPGESATFLIRLVAPQTPGVYDFQWQMARGGVHWFGEKSANIAIRVFPRDQSKALVEPIRDYPPPPKTSLFELLFAPPP